MLTRRGSRLLLLRDHRRHRWGNVGTRTRGETKVPATATWDQPVPILIHIISFVDQATLRKVSTVCKQLHQICHGHVLGTTNIVIPVLELSASPDKPDFRRTDRVVHQLEQHCTKLQHYRKVTIVDGHKFRHGEDRYETQTKLENTQLILNGVVSLHWLGSVQAEHMDDLSLPLTLARIFPNLREIDLSTSEYCCRTLLDFSTRCANLEKVTWNNFDRSSCISMDGAEMGSATNLKEIYMDGAQFHDHYWNARDFETDDRPAIFLFYMCQSKVLERISIRNARTWFWENNGSAITQKMLIKFIRKAPTSLRWFRSDLTPANMAMLRLERPEIELLN